MDKESNTEYHLNKIKMVFKPRDREEKDLDGFYVANPGYTIGINIFGIWGDVEEDKRIKHKENRFIKRFAQTVMHEFLHRECEEIKAELFSFREEGIIRSLVGESWNENEQKEYKSERSILP